MVAWPAPLQINKIPVLIIDTCIVFEGQYFKFSSVQFISFPVALKAHKLKVRKQGVKM